MQSGAIKKQANKNQRKSGAILSYVSIIANTLIQLLYTPFLISKLGQSEYGLYSLVSSIIGYLTVLDLGFGNAIIVHTAKYHTTGEKEKEQTLHGMFNIIYIIIGIVAGLAGVILSIFGNSIFGSTMTSEEIQKMKIMLLILSLNLFLTFSFSIYSSIIAANEKFIFQKTLTIISTIIRPLLMIPILFMGFKSIALCIIITITNIAVLISNYIFCRKKLNVKIKFKGFDKNLFKTIFSFSIWIFITQIVDKINWSADQFILGAVSGTKEVSIYSIAATINTLFINTSTAISNVFLPKISGMIANKATSKELTEEMIRVGRLQFYIVFLVLIAYILFGKQFIQLWVGEDFTESYYVGLCLIIPAFFALIQNLGLSIMQAMNKYKFKAISTFIMSFFNILISYFLAKQFNAVGAALGTTISLVICNIILINIYYYKALKINVLAFWKNIIAMMIKYIAPLAIIIIPLTLLRLNNFMTICIFAPILLITYSLVSYFTIMNQYEKNLTRSIFKKFKIRRRK